MTLTDNLAKIREALVNYRALLNDDAQAVEAIALLDSLSVPDAKHPVRNPEVLVADIRAAGAAGKGKWKMSRKAAGDAVIAFTKNWAENVLSAPDEVEEVEDE